jgi:hypothetical protein
MLCHLDAFCSVDGDMWFTASTVDLSKEDVQFGVHAVELKDPLIYAGRCIDETVMCFGPFWL